MKIRKVFAVALIAAICLSLYFVYAPASAEDLALTAQDGLCVHHPEHTVECGYYLETGENTCSHVHDDICGYVAPVDAQPCNHTHDASCGYVEATEEVLCDKGCTDQDGDGVIDHGEACAYRPEGEGSPCTHAHDEFCGYVAPVEGQSCNHVHDARCGYVEEGAAGQCVYAVSGCPYCIVSWQWSDASGVLADEDGEACLALAGVSVQNPVTEEQLRALLPASILAESGSGLTYALPLSWDLSALSFPLSQEGAYLLEASLEAPYALTAAAAPLRLPLRLGGAETYDNELTIPEGPPPYSEHIVAGVSPAGTTINLFDYWVTNRTDADNGDTKNNNYYNKGINANHALLFITGDLTYFNPGNWNKWTGDGSMTPNTPEKPYAGIVKKNLQGGYPVLNDLNTSDNSLHQSMQDRDGRESLAYLFDPKMESQGKASFSDVKGLLQVDKDGYYYYNSRQNYAVFYEEDNAFTLYDHPGVIPGGSSPVGQFFPFNQATGYAENVEHKGELYDLMNRDKSTVSSINHYFGMHMSTRFIQQNGGYMDKEQSIPITYEFSGDDDVWIFIDDILVADLGGIHDMASVTINFAYGTVVINEGKEASEQLFYLKDIMGLSDATFANNTYHTLDLFYLERGNTDSNLYLRYNLVTIPESSLIKVDQVGEPVPGAEFKLYAANNLEQSIATGVTDMDGSFVFRRTEGDIGYGIYGERPITIDELYNQYKDEVEGNSLILKETKTPAGYRTNGDVGLKFETVGTDENKKVVLLSNSTWDKGAYAMPKVTATMPFKITLNDSQGTPTGKTVDLTEKENPLIFAVVFQRQGDSLTEWHPVSGDPIRGWKVHEGSTWEYVLAAARANPYIFTLGSGGRYQAEITNLPGDIATYYNLLGTIEGAKYTVGYYYSEASSLEQVTSDNTYRISALEGQDDKIGRVFSVNLYVSNIKNRLLVQKVDDEGTPINGAVFSLYREEDVTVDQDGSFTIKDGAKAYDTVETAKLASLQMDGGGIFPTAGKVLENGEYYLVETYAPYGYKKSEKATHIVVNNTGVYANAGVADDGIEVLRGVGSIIHSMVQFAAGDDVNTTLHNIKAVLASGTTAGSGIYWEDPETVWEAATKVLHLQFKEGSTILDYDLEEASSMSTLDDLTFKTDEGWSKLLIRQCETHKSTGSGAWQNLGDQDLTNLFSGTVTVRVTNERVGNLKITKTVTAEPGQTAPEEVEFTFKLYNRKGGTPISGTYNTMDQANVQSTITFKNGETSLKLKGGESLTIFGLPYDSQYDVKEELLTGFSVSSNTGGIKTEGTTASGSIPHTKDEDTPHTVDFTNHYDGKTRVSIDIQKTMLGRNLKNGETYTFFVLGADEDTKPAVEQGIIELPNAITLTGTGSATWVIRSAEITFYPNEPATYTFAINEDNSNPYDGVLYDQHTAYVTVEVFKNTTTKKWEAKVIEYDNSGALNDADKNLNNAAAFTNTGAYDLTIEKTVDGSMGDREKPFDFTITVSEALDGVYNCTLSGQGGQPQETTITLDNGEATFTLSHGQSFTIKGLPVGTEYTITESGAVSDGYQVTAKIEDSDNNGTMTRSSDETQFTGTLDQETTVIFTNKKGEAVPTGIRLDALPWLLALLCGLAGCTALCVTGKTQRRKGGCGSTHG